MTNEKKTLDQQFSEKSGIDVSKKERGVDLNPVIGMGVTRSINCDSYPYTIIDILNVKGKKILKIESDANEYEHDREIHSVHYLIQEQKFDQYKKPYTDWVDIKWNERTKRWNKGTSYYYHSIGERRYSLDPSF